MKDLFLKRNELRRKSIRLRSMRFEPNVKDEQIDIIAKEQDEIYKKFQFYKQFLLAKEKAKREEKKLN